MSENMKILDSDTREMITQFVSEGLDSLDTNEPYVEYLREYDNSEHVNAIFRVFHTLKGLSGFFDLKITKKVTHEAETLLDLIRKQNKPQNEDTITVIFQTFDFLRDILYKVSTDFTDESAGIIAEDMILILKDCLEKVKNPINIEDYFSEDSYMLKEPSTEIVEEVLESDSNSGLNINLDDVNEEVIEEVSNSNITFESEFDDSILTDELLDQFLVNAFELIDLVDKNLIELEKNPDNTKLIPETFGAVHSLKGNSGFMGLSEIEDLAMDMETILDSLRSGDLTPEPHIITIILSNSEIIRNLLDTLQEKSSAHTKKENKYIESPTPVNTNEIVEISETPKTENKVQKSPIAPVDNSATFTPKEVDANAGQHSAHIQKKDIRVETIKIDKLFDLVGELITIEAMVTNNPDLIGLDLPNFNKSANMLNKITRELQEISMSIRMMPLEGTFNKMKRLVRDVSIKMNKKVNLLISGADTEMDKNVIDEIADPLVHLLRNSVDHGIENIEQRIANGKSEIGTIKLGAKYEGNEILITIEDDGAGIIRDKILAKAEEKGILKVSPDLMSDKDVFKLIFEPGFSTAAQITDISGRGVGMDVVKKNIEKLHGSIDVDSIAGKGTKITLRIPLTLAIMESMIIRIGESRYALPILAINESFRSLNTNITVTMDGLEVIKVRNDVLPIIRLHDQFDIEPDSKNLLDGIMIIIEAKNKKVCLFADEIVGQQQAVVKGLGDYIGKVPGVTGCMILGDGGIGLILDIDGLLEMSENTLLLKVS
jgi:two-component system chemotaxis sensor kinase CheA